MKKILFDLLSSQPSGTSKFHGGGEYAKTIFKEICNYNNEEIKVIVFFNKNKFIDKWILDLIKEKNIEYVNISKHEELLELNIISDIDVLFAGQTGYYYNINLPKNIKKIGVFHGLRSLECPIDYYSYMYDEKFIDKTKSVLKYVFKYKYFNVLKNRESNSLAKFDYLIAVSEHSKYSFNINYPNKNMDMVKVFYSPAKYVDKYNNFNKKDKKFKYILMLGGNRWIKNTYRGLLALDSLISDQLLNDIKVIVVGKCSKKILSKLNNLNRFKFLDYVNSDELETLYENCELFFYPTLNEGFGYPPLEAMRYNKTCLISNVCSLPELYKDAVYYCNPYDIMEMKIRIRTAIENKINLEKVKIRFDEISKKQHEDLQGLCKFIVNT
ncbi:MAG: glycosyltransferase [Clostridium saudiense]|uniref:glycosyltransferase n=1 Tax=Clostridium saudiense TaxID=1414720 RepID=UPI003993C5F3